MTVQATIDFSGAVRVNKISLTDDDCSSGPDDEESVVGVSKEISKDQQHSGRMGVRGATKHSTKNKKLHDVESQPQVTQGVLKEGSEPTVTVVSTLDAYHGDNLGEKVDAFIESHPVVMFNKTWCLFSMDAQEFLTNTMKVSLHAIEVDAHEHGRAILKHVQDRTKHKTVPVIFIKGEFLGGFEDVNQLYATGRLQQHYLHDLTQADRCQEFITRGKLGTKPLFWFPETVDGHVVRLMGIMSSLCSAMSSIAVYRADWGKYLAYALLLDYFLRFFGGARASILGRIAILMARPFDPKERHGRPKQFATMCGVTFSGLGSIMYALPFVYTDWIGMGFMACLALAAGSEAFLDFCLGCFIFKYGIKMGLIPK